MNALAQQWITRYQLQAHPEGGYFKETIAATDQIQPEGRASRPMYTSILFLLCDTDVSHFHRLLSDELWVFQGGDPLCVITIDDSGRIETIRLGFGEDDALQAVVKKGMIFGSYVPNHGTSMVACIVSPGFLYDEFTLIGKEELRRLIPSREDLIELLGISE